MHWEPLLMAVLLLVLGTLAFMVLIGPTVGPSRHDGRRSFAALVWRNLPTVYSLYEKSMLLLGSVGLFAGAIYCVKLALTP